MSEENKEILEQKIMETDNADTPTADTASLHSEQADQPKQPEQIPTPVYQYRWSYQTEAAYQARHKKGKKRRGILLYATIMVTVFLLCFAILFAMLSWYGEAQTVERDTVPTLSQVFENVAPATVLVQARTASGSGMQGTGFFVRSDGYIVTNQHVVDKATSITVRLYSGRNYAAELIGSDKTADLAVLKINGTDFSTVVLGNSDDVSVGDRAIAIGNPMGAEGAWSMTVGIVSSPTREVTTSVNGQAVTQTYIQTDAAVNPGNSGGVLCNEYGEVIGVVTLKMKEHEGIGCAIPINRAIEIFSPMIGG